MNAYNLSLILALVTVLLGVYLDQMWIGFGLALVIFVMLTFAKPKPRPKPKPAPGPQQVAVQQVPEYPKDIMDFYKRGAKKSKPLLIQTVPYEKPWHEKILVYNIKIVGWIFKKIGKGISTFLFGEKEKKE